MISSKILQKLLNLPSSGNEMSFLSLWIKYGDARKHVCFAENHARIQIKVMLQKSTTRE
jgi:hypothetical protein